jgi:hypothetical protein
MPNYCYNTVLIKGPKKDVLRLQKQVKNRKQDFSLNKILPQPKILNMVVVPGGEWNEHMGKKMKGKMVPKRLIALWKKLYGTDNWYDWRRENWGTKWDIHDAILEIQGNKVDDNEREIVYSFDSAWMGPDQAILALSEQYPMLHIEHYEEELGSDFAYEKIYEGGQCLEENDKLEEAHANNNEND